MRLETKHFGTLEVDEDKIIDFIGGVPGFDGTKYILMKNKDDELSPFMWLQSVTNGDISLLLMNPFLIYPNYAPDVRDEYITGLEHNGREDLTVYNVVVLPDDLTKMTINLKAPIIINAEKKKAIQVIAENQDYDIRHYLYEDMKKLKSTTDGGDDK